MALYPPRAPVKQMPRGDFDPESFRRLIFQNGARVIWEQVHLCPCGRKVADLTSDMTDLDVPEGFIVTGESPGECPRCSGTGFFLTDPQEIPVVISGMREAYRRFAHAGEFEEGVASVTFLPEHKIAPGHRLTMTKSVISVREMRKRGTTVVEALRFPIVEQTLDLATGPSVRRVLWMQKANLANISGTGDTLVEGVDFDVSLDGKVDWAKGVANGHAPLQNALYSVEYYAHPRYRITDILHSVRDTYVQSHAPAPVFSTMPIQGAAKLEYLGTQVL